jgi:Ca2+-binding EF-hand superfamily protein
MKQLPQVEYNEVLSAAAKKELPNFRGKPSYNKYRRTDAIGGIVPEYYKVAKPALLADDGADEPINVLTKILLDKQDKFKEGRDILCDPKFTQVGIAHEMFDEENMVILIFATDYVEDEPEYELPSGDLSELKQAFDILDVNGKQKLNMKEIMKALDDMQFFKTNPTLYSILKDLSDKEKCSWPKFASFVNARMTDRETKEGLNTIFNLFIDDPNKGTISFETFKKICSEIDCGLSEKELYEIVKASTANGEEITFKEFQEYMTMNSQ